MGETYVFPSSCIASPKVLSQQFVLAKCKIGNGKSANFFSDQTDVLTEEILSKTLPKASFIAYFQ